MSVEIGTTAPDFALGSHRGDTVRLSDFRGRQHVVIAFHPLAFTPVCATQMQNYEADQDWFGAHETHVLGISVDSVPAKIAWAKALDGITFDLLSDFHPHGGVAEAYGVLRDGGISERAIFVVDKAGQVVFAKIYDIPTLPDNAEVRQAILNSSGAPHLA